MILEKTLKSPVDSKEIKSVNPKANQPWIYIGRHIHWSDAEAEAPILWPPDAKSWLIRKDPDVGKDWGQEEKRASKDGMVGWHQWLNGHEFKQTLGNGKAQGSLAAVNGVPNSRIWLSSWTAMNSTTAKMMLVRPRMTNLKITVSADYTVSACSPLLLA